MKPGWILCFCGIHKWQHAGVTLPSLPGVWVRCDRCAAYERWLDAGRFVYTAEEVTVLQENAMSGKEPEPVKPRRGIPNDAVAHIVGVEMVAEIERLKLVNESMGKLFQRLMDELQHCDPTCVETRDLEILVLEFSRVLNRTGCNLEFARIAAELRTFGDATAPVTRAHPALAPAREPSEAKGAYAL